MDDALFDAAAPGAPAAAQGSEWNLLPRMERTAIGARRGDGATLVRRRDRPGCVLCGPFWQLQPGCYRLLFRCRAARPRMPDQPALGVEIIAANRFQHAWADFTAGELEQGAATIDFTVPFEQSRDSGDDFRFEARFFHLGNADLAISAVSLRRLPPTETPTPAPHRWRLLGRLRKPGIGRRGSGGVRVRAGGRPRRLLDGMAPHLQLPRGRYRLRLEGSLDGAAAPATPVVAVDILAVRRWRRPHGWQRLLLPPADSGTLVAAGEVTATQLREGAATIDFSVPSEPSLDDGDGARFQLRLHYLGNAAVRLDGIVLQALEGPAAAAVAPDAATPRRAPGSQRGTAVLVGNCQAQIVHIALSRDPDLGARFDAKCHFVNLQQSLHETGKRDLERAEFVLAQDIKDWEDYPLRDAIPERARIVKFPLLHFASLWPFDQYNGIGDREAHEREWPNLTFSYLDGLLGRLRREIPDPEERFRAYRDLKVDGVINLTRFHDFESRRLAAIDRKFEVEIGAYILERFRARRLFYTTAHPNGELLAMLMRYIARCLEVRTGARRFARLEHLDYLEVPVHPLVAKTLGVGWAHEKTLYRVGGERITWETYVRRYIAHYG